MDKTQIQISKMNEKAREKKKERCWREEKHIP